MNHYKIKFEKKLSNDERKNIEEIVNNSFDIQGNLSLIFDDNTINLKFNYGDENKQMNNFKSGLDRNKFIIIEIVKVS